MNQYVTVNCVPVGQVRSSPVPPLPLAKSLKVGHFSQWSSIEVLSDDVLLIIFRHYRDATPRIWHTLAGVCQRWRLVVFTLPRTLNLLLYCLPGTPVLKTLDSWPPLPIIIQYGGLPNLDPPTLEDDDNVIAALKQSDRVRSISLTLTSSLLEKFSAIFDPFSELEELALLSQDNMPLTLPSTFRWGSRLRTLHSTRVSLPSFPQLISLSRDLVDIQLNEIPSAGYFPPEEFANALSAMSNLRSLSLHFLSFPPRRKYLGLPSRPWERAFLPVLTCLTYRGISKYLDTLVARIDAPHLRVINITFFHQPTIDVFQLGQFLERTGLLIPLSHADVQSFAHAISISFTDSSTSTLLQLHISCKQLDWQFHSMAQICDQFSPSLFRVKGLDIHTTRPSSGQDDVDCEQWLQLIRAFWGAKDFRVAGEFATKLLPALCLVESAVQPGLRTLHIEEPMLGVALCPLSDFVESFDTPRRLSSSPIQIFTSWPRHSCQDCISIFPRQTYLNSHIQDRHPNQNVCPYCRAFHWPHGNKSLFREHLDCIHPEVSLTDALPPFLAS
jgi:hypothetical protein